MLEELGYRALIVRSGKQAQDVYGKQKEAIGLVILDMVMPGMGGGETCDRMKAMPFVKAGILNKFIALRCSSAKPYHASQAGNSGWKCHDIGLRFRLAGSNCIGFRGKAPEMYAQAC